MCYGIPDGHTAFQNGQHCLAQARTYQAQENLEQARKQFSAAKEALKVAYASSDFNQAEVMPLLAQAYLERGDVLCSLGLFRQAHASYHKARKYDQAAADQKIADLPPLPPTWWDCFPCCRPSPFTPTNQPSLDTPKRGWFDHNPQPPAPTPPYTLAVVPAYIFHTQHLAWCLQHPMLEQTSKEALKDLAIKTIDAFGQSGKNLAEVQEVVALATIADLDLYRQLMGYMVGALSLTGTQTDMLNLNTVQALAVILDHCPDALLEPSHLGQFNVLPGDLVAVLSVLCKGLDSAHRGNDPVQVHSLLYATCHLLDAMIKIGVSGIHRTGVQEPLYATLQELSVHANSAIAYQARYAYQALTHIPNDETFWHSVGRHVFHVGMGILSLASAVKNLDVNNLSTTFDHFEQAFAFLDGLKNAVQDWQTAIASASQGFEVHTPTGWYAALRFCDLLIAHDNFVAFGVFVRQNHYQQHPNFLQGLCLRLEQIACTQADQEIQQNAQCLLERLHSDPAQHPAVMNAAERALARLQAPDPSIKPVWAPFWFTPRSTELLVTARLRQIQLDESLRKTLPLAMLGSDIKALEAAYLEILEAAEIKEGLMLYIAPQGMRRPDATERFDLDPQVDAFLVPGSPEKVLLLLGQAGSGKSTFSYHLAHRLWKTYKEDAQKAPIPIFIPLRELTVKGDYQDLMASYFERKGFSKSQIEILQHNRQFVFIFDGYDEITSRARDFYTTNKLDKWHAKVIISSRPEYLGVGYQRNFGPSGLLQEWWLAPFSDPDINAYIDHYVQAKPREWAAEDYHKNLLVHPELKKLMGNPLLLKMVLQVAPTLQQNGQVVFTRVALYEQFIKDWLARAQLRSGQIQLTGSEQASFDQLCEGDFIALVWRFSQDFALALYRHPDNKVEATYSDVSPEKNPKWAVFLNNNDEKTRLLRFNAPLIRQGDTYSFIHKSIRDYLVARAIWQEPALQQGNPDALLNQFNLVEDPAVLDFIVEHVQDSLALIKPWLFAYINRSKTDASVACAAANAITILVKAGMQFNGADFKGIQIPGADLSYGVFDSAQFQSIPGEQRTDLSKVRLQGAWLRRADFSGAKMQDVQFGELPGLQFDEHVSVHCYSSDDHFSACCYSSDGRWLAIAQGRTIRLYDPKTLEEKKCLTGHKFYISSVALSSDGRYVVSPGTGCHTVWVWDLHAQPIKPRILTGHTGWVNSVALSSDGRYVISGSKDKTVRVWDLHTPSANPHILAGHGDSVNSVALSSDGRYVASGSEDKTVRVWDLHKPSAPPVILAGHNAEVLSVALSSDGRYVISGSKDKTVRVWDLNAPSTALHIFAGDNGRVVSVALSSDGRYVISSHDGDHAVRVWDLQTPSAPPRTLAGHANFVRRLALSPDDRYVVSCDDHAVRVWDLYTPSAAPCNLAGHTSWVRSVALSSDGQYVISVSLGGKVRVWDLQAQPIKPRILTEYWVKSVALSSNGQYVISGSLDNKVRVWDLRAQPATQPSILGEHKDWVNSVALSQDDRYVVSGSYDNLVRVWDLEAPSAALHILSGHTRSVNSVALSSDNRYVISGSGDETVRVWDLHAPSTPLHILAGHDSDVWCVALSPDNQYILSGSGDHTARVWDIASGQCLMTIKDFSGSVSAAIWKKIGNLDYVVTGSYDKAVRWWQLIKDKDGKPSQVRLRWTSTQEALNLSEANIESVEGLSPLNQQLLKQRGAVGEPQKDEGNKAAPRANEMATNTCSALADLNLA